MGSKNEIAIEASGLVKRYSGNVLAVDGVDLSVPANTIYALLGPNGADKTTTISILTTLIEPTTGSARVVGFDVVRQAGEVRRRIGVTFQEMVLDDDLTGRQALDYHGKLYRQKVKQLLIEAGHPDGFEITFLTYNNLTMTKGIEIGRRYYLRFLFSQENLTLLPLCFLSFLFTFSIKIFRDVRGLSPMTNHFPYFFVLYKLGDIVSSSWVSKQLRCGQMLKIVVGRIKKQVLYASGG